MFFNILTQIAPAPPSSSDSQSPADQGKGFLDQKSKSNSSEPPTTTPHCVLQHLSIGHTGQCDSHDHIKEWKNLSCRDWEYRSKCEKRTFLYETNLPKRSNEGGPPAPKMIKAPHTAPARPQLPLCSHVLDAASLSSSTSMIHELCSVLRLFFLGCIATAVSYDGVAP